MLKSHQCILNKFFKQKSQHRLHHSSIFKIQDYILIDCLINSLCSIILDIKIEDYKNSPYITILSFENNKIQLSEIKKIIKNCELTAHNSIAKVIVILNLDLLNDLASNALLKTLEEPMSNNYFLMFTKNYTNVLDTMKSRSLSYNIQLSKQDKEKYLRYTFNMTDQAIARSLQITRGDINIVTKIKCNQEFWKMRLDLLKVIMNQYNLSSFLKYFAPQYGKILYWLSSIVVDIYEIKLGCNNTYIANYDKITTIKFISNKFSEEQIFYFYKQCLEARGYFNKFRNIDKELILENIIIRLQL